MYGGAADVEKGNDYETQMNAMVRRGFVRTYLCAVLIPAREGADDRFSSARRNNGHLRDHRVPLSVRWLPLVRSRR